MALFREKKGGEARKKAPQGSSGNRERHAGGFKKGSEKGSKKKKAGRILKTVTQTDGRSRASREASLQETKRKK